MNDSSGLRILSTFILPPVFSMTSRNVLSTAKLFSGIKRWAVKIRGVVSSIACLRFGSNRGAINQRYNMPTPAAMLPGTMKSKIPNAGTPKSCATLTTNRLVDVPIVVVIPPNKVAKPIGINIPDVLVPVLTDTEIKIGSSKTTIGVLLTKALKPAPINIVPSNDSMGLSDHSLVNTWLTASRAPVLTRPCPAIIKPQTANNASCPKPEKK